MLLFHTVLVPVVVVVVVVRERSVVADSPCARYRADADLRFTME